MVKNNVEFILIIIKHSFVGLEEAKTLFMTFLDPRALLNTLPSNPGVYQLRNAQWKVIYVGKARNLKKRIGSYFHRRLDHKTQVMMDQVHSIQTIITNNENEALLLEANFIKQLRPRYNVLLRDDKSYPYLYLSTHEKFPRLEFYRGSKKSVGRYFGPYPSAGSMRENLALVQKLFKLRQCKDSLFKNRTRPCLQYQIKRCTAPCVGYVDEENYRYQVEDAILFFEGKNEEVINKLIERMEVTSKDLDFEAAAHYRDKIQQLRQLQKQQFITSDEGDVDVIGAVKLDSAVGLVILFIRSGRIIGHKAFFPIIPTGTDLPTTLAEFIPQYYLSPLRNGNIPKRIIISERLTDRLWIQRALESGLNRVLLVISNQKHAPYKQWQHIAVLNAKQALSQHLTRKNTFTAKFKALEKALLLPNPVSRIECFDISHNLGEATVGACVVFGVEGSIKKDYRRFNILGVQPGDDYGALRKVLARHYTRLKESNGIFPDLLMIDGGMGQLRQAVEVLKELQVSSVLLLSIAKGLGRKAGLEKIFIWHREEIHLSSENIAFHLIQQIRDEAHRFAITAHRAQCVKRRVKSSLEDIKGIGPQRRQELLKYFGGLQELQKASIEEIVRVPSINEKIAKLIYEALHLTSK